MKSTRMPRAARSGQHARDGRLYTAASKAAANLTVYGRVAPGQDVAVGSYTDTVVATVNFYDLPAGAAPPVRRRSAAWLPVAAAFLCAAVARPAGAATFSVDPTLITLSPRASSTLLVVRNESPQPVRLQVSAVAWSQGLDGDMQVQPTEVFRVLPVALHARARPGLQGARRHDGELRRRREVLPALSGAAAAGHA